LRKLRRAIAANGVQSFARLQFGAVRGEDFGAQSDLRPFNARQSRNWRVAIATDSGEKRTLGIDGDECFGVVDYL
jgi:hypothetical protein